MKSTFWKKIFIINVVMLLCLVAAVPKPGAQFFPYAPAPYLSPFPVPYFPFSFIPPLPLTSPLLFGTGLYRVASVPTATSIFPAPTLPAVPVATTGGVGVSSLIPTIPAAVTVPASAFITNPLAPLITYTPLSLIGLTYAPVPVSATPAPVPLAPILPTTPVTTTSITVGSATTANIISLLSSLLL
ncbi:MAG: hypothetical protein ACMUIA_12395 [bacterium]